MEMIVGCIFTLILIVFLYFFCRNVTITVKLEYPEVKTPEFVDIYDKDGEEKTKEDTIDFDNMLKEIHELMLDQEDTNG